MTDYLIFAVRYNSEHTHIIAVRQILNRENSIATTVDRLEVVSNIHAGLTYATAYANNGEWKYGNQIFIDEVDGTEYIKTEPDGTIADNLGELSEF